MNSDTDKCPKCGSAVVWYGEPYPDAGNGQQWECGVCCCFQHAEDKMPADSHYPAMMHRIRELEMSEAILRGGAEYLKRQVEELGAENERMRLRDGNATITVIEPTGANPFARARLAISDFGVADNVYVVEQSARYKELEAERAAACEYLERLFVSWLRQHFPDNDVTKPLTGDLIGLITQIDNAATKWQELEAENERMREALEKCAEAFEIYAESHKAKADLYAQTLSQESKSRLEKYGRNMRLACMAREALKK